HLQSLLQMQVREEEQTPTPPLECLHAGDCDSYSCVSSKCEKKMVCRYADEGEIAAGPVQCGGKMVKDAGGVCGPSEEMKKSVYIGLLNELTIKPVGQCQFNVDQDTQIKAIAAMKSLRAMEWLLSS